MKKLNHPVFVTQPALPPLKEFTDYLEKIWNSKILTNNGPLHSQFEEELARYLGVKYLSLFSNATLALITGLQAMKISGEVITTPFSFVATTHSLWWNQIKPVFIDIERENFTIDPSRIEAAITKDTTAIMPVHVYGYPCKIHDIQKIADQYGLKIIYDAAHTFAVKVDNIPILQYGDLSILSFHATKVFNTIEGGAIICNDEKTKKRIDYLKNFGFTGETTVIEPGINAKMNELQAAYGLLQLKYIDENIRKRKTITNLYRKLLIDTNGISIKQEIDGVSLNYAYFPIIVDPEKYGKSRDELYEILKKFDVYSRRYFFPLISNFKPYNELPSAKQLNLPVANYIADRILCLPIYPDLEIEDVEKICHIINNISNL